MGQEASGEAGSRQLYPPREGRVPKSAPPGASACSVRSDAESVQQAVSPSFCTGFPGSSASFCDQANCRSL